MFAEFGKVNLYIFIILFFQGCMTLGSERFVINSDTFSNKYSTIKQVVVQEAANNGFSELTAEIKPSEFNDWKGSLFFQLKTGNGTDQLFVEFAKANGGISVYTHGAGTRANANSAAKAIKARLSQL